MSEEELANECFIDCEDEDEDNIDIDLEEEDEEIDENDGLSDNS